MDNWLLSPSQPLRSYQGKEKEEKDKLEKMEQKEKQTGRSSLIVIRVLVTLQGRLCRSSGTFRIVEEEGQIGEDGIYGEANWKKLIDSDTSTGDLARTTMPP